jgi:hypothetical protein
VSAATVTVWEVLYLCDGPGQYGDGVATARFRSERDAKAFAAGRRYYSGPATATMTKAPRKVAQRWGMA